MLKQEYYPSIRLQQDCRNTEYERRNDVIRRICGWTSQILSTTRRTSTSSSRATAGANGPGQTFELTRADTRSRNIQLFACTFACFPNFNWLTVLPGPAELLITWMAELGRSSIWCQASPHRLKLNHFAQCDPFHFQLVAPL